MPIGIVCRSVPRQAAGCSLLRRFPSTPAYRRTRYVLPERGPHRTMEIPKAHPCRHAKGAKWRSAGAEPCDPHLYLVGIQKMEEGDVRGRVVPRKRAVELGTFGHCPEGKKKKTDRTGPDNAVSPWDGTRTCRPWNDPRGSRGHKENKLKSVFSGSQDILGLAGRGLVPSGWQYGAEGTRVPSWGANSGLEPGWHKLCPLWKQQQEGVAPVSSSWFCWSVFDDRGLLTLFPPCACCAFVSGSRIRYAMSGYHQGVKMICVHT